MTEEQINRIAELVVEKLSAKQEEYDKAFQADMKSMMEESKSEGEVSFGMTTSKELIKDQILKLEHELEVFVTAEDYTKAQKTKDKIKDLKSKYGL
jgi:protein-arginine kinase activator protein McsA